MELLDPRLALLSLGVASVTSERVRKGVGRGIGYVAVGAMTVGNTLVHTGQDIVEEARNVSGQNGRSKATTRRKRPAAAT